MMTIAEAYRRLDELKALKKRIYIAIDGQPYIAEFRDGVHQGAWLFGAPVYQITATHSDGTRRVVFLSAEREVTIG